jgi:hypothetical protein
MMWHAASPTIAGARDETLNAVAQDKEVRWTIYKSRMHVLSLQCLTPISSGTDSCYRFMIRARFVYGIFDDENCPCHQVRSAMLDRSFSQPCSLVSDCAGYPS